VTVSSKRGLARIAYGRGNRFPFADLYRVPGGAIGKRNYGEKQQKISYRQGRQTEKSGDHEIT
jgi:hypothetical protein